MVEFMWGGVERDENKAVKARRNGLEKGGGAVGRGEGES